jgi:hypothetical protein
MNRIFFLFCCFINISNLFSQENDVVAVLNSFVKYEVFDHFNHFYLHDKSLVLPKEKITLYKLQKRNLLLKHPDFPLQLLDTATTNMLNWKVFNIKKAKYHSDTATESYPKDVYTVNFIPFKTSQKEFDSLQKNRKPYTFYVKNNKYWSDKNRWLKAYKTWDSIRKSGGEERYYFYIGVPIFSKNRKYARVIHRTETTCGYKSSVTFYKKQTNMSWKCILELDYGASEKRVRTHVRCDEPLFDYQY